MFIFPYILYSIEIIIYVQIHVLTPKTILFQLSKQCLHGTNLHAPHHALHISDHHTPYVQQHADPHAWSPWLVLHVTGSGHRGEAMHAHSIGICAHINSITRSSLWISEVQRHEHGLNFEWIQLNLLTSLQATCMATRHDIIWSSAGGEEQSSPCVVM